MLWILLEVPQESENSPESQASVAAFICWDSISKEHSGWSRLISVTGQELPVRCRRAAPQTSGRGQELDRGSGSIWGEAESHGPGWFYAAVVQIGVR